MIIGIISIIFGKVKNKYGKNAMLKAMNLQDGAMQITRNGQIGGHKA